MGDKKDIFPIKLSSLFGEKKKIKKIQSKIKFKVIPFYMENTETIFQRKNIFHLHDIMQKEKDRISTFDIKFQNLLKPKNYRRNLLYSNNRNSSQSNINNASYSQIIKLPKIKKNKILKDNYSSNNSNLQFYSSKENNQSRLKKKLRTLYLIKNFSASNINSSHQLI